MAVILVVDDNAEIRSMVDEFLRIKGHTVLCAQNGVVGQALLDSHFEAIEILISDIYMPEMDGLEMIRTALAKKPTLKVIAMSAGDRTGNLSALEFAGDFGAADLLSKPFLMPDLLALVERALSKSAESGGD